MHINLGATSESSEDALLEQAKQHNIQGIEYQNANLLHKAEEEYKKAVELNPSYEAAYSNLVSTLERRNKIEEARKYVDLANELFPDGLFITLNEAIVLKREGKLEEAVSVLTTKPYPDDTMTEIKVRHELGLIYDRMEETDKAFEQFNAFNSFAYEAFGINEEIKAQYRGRIEKCKQTFTPEFLSFWEKATPAEKTPVCQMGFPRCGTTLLQHILNSHPSVYAAEEVNAFTMIEGQVIEAGGYPENIADISEQDIKTLRERYFEIHRQDHAYQEADIFVDKLPLLGAMTGLVYRLFPDTKFIFCKRHPCDVIISGYMQLFAPNEAMVHFYNLDDLVNLYTNYMDLWQQYEEILPLNVHYICYENITKDFKGEIEPLMQFLGLSWDDELLNYNENARKLNVISPSYEQVSEKIYTRAAYRWERYREHMEPYLDRLQPYIERLGYAEEQN